MRQEEEEKKDTHPQEKEDASPSSPFEEEGLGLNTKRKFNLL